MVDLAFALLANLAAGGAPHCWKFAQRPPMGWNSWDCFATTVTESQIKAHADFMAEKLKPFGWKYIVVDIQWYEPNAKSFEYRHGAELSIDAHGRLLPAVNRFPSAAAGAGFTKLAEYVHGKGLKFGLHLLRGIPRQAVRDRLAILGTSYTAADIADEKSICQWNPDMYGIDTSKPGAQAYYDSVFKQFADWKVDFVKVDDISRPYHQAEVEAIRRAIDRAKRPMVLSLSPGETALNAGPNVSQNANMWRISDDFWDNWGALVEQFERCKNWAPFTGPGHFPDADMLPLGKVRFGEQSHFTRDEVKTMLTLWAIFRSPLMLGCDLTQLDADTLSLITNANVLAVNQTGYDARQVRRNAHAVVWESKVARGKDHYLALFNLADTNQELSVSAGELNGKRFAKVTDLWSNESVPASGDQLSAKIPAHGAMLYRVRLVD